VAALLRVSLLAPRQSRLVINIFRTLAEFMKSFAIHSFLLLSTSVALLEAQLSIPQLGAAHYPDGSVHLIRGIGANLIVDPHNLAAADAASFSDSGGLLSAKGLIRMQRSDGTVVGEYRSVESTPLLHMDSTVSSAAVWLPSKHLLLRWDGARFAETSIDDSSFGGPVTFVHLASQNAAQFFVTRSDSSVGRVTVSLPSGRVTSSDTEPAAHGWVFLQQGWTLSQDEYGLTAERVNGSRQSIALGRQPLQLGDLHVEQMSNHWIHVSSRFSDAGWAVYLDPNKVNAYLLPPPAPEAKR